MMTGFFGSIHTCSANAVDMQARTQVWACMRVGQRAHYLHARVARGTRVFSGKPSLAQQLFLDVRACRSRTR